MSGAARAVVPYSGALDASAQKSDTVNLTHVTRAIYVGGAGNISAVMFDGSPVLLTGVLVGVIYELSIKRLNNATTATLVIGLY